ncbi:MAG: PDZ domain-containing protein [Desulfuromonadales bacterium]|nr:MAG: PDZ domain-containing protein [Desulfuromonadales bacterium]
MKKVYLLTILLLVLNSLAAAHLAAGIVTHRLSRSYPKAAATPSPPRADATNDELASFAPILDRGLFGKATQGALTPVTARSAPAAGGPAAAQGDLILVGTARGSFRETFALIRRSAPPEERVFRPGDQVFGAGRLVSVRKESVEILAGNRRIRLLTPTAIPVEPPPSPAGHPVTQMTTGSAIIDQRLLNAALDNIGQAMTDARLLPSLKEGKVEGFRVSEVKPSGVFATVGIRNGDVLLRINELPIDSPERAIQTLASLKGQNRIRIDLLRDGQPATFTYDIR